MFDYINIKKKNDNDDLTKNNYQNKVVFCTGAGRCGTHFITDVIEREKNIAASAIRNPIRQNFHRFCQWNDLPIDHGGFLGTMKKEIDNDLEKNEISFESSPYLSLSILELKEKFNAKFIFLIRNPELSVRSMYSKGWYGEKNYHDDMNLIRGIQPDLKIHHFLPMYMGKMYIK